MCLSKLAARRKTELPPGQHPPGRPCQRSPTACRDAAVGVAGARRRRMPCRQARTQHPAPNAITPSRNSAIMCGIVGYIGPPRGDRFSDRRPARGWSTAATTAPASSTIDGDGDSAVTKTAGRIDDLVARLKTSPAAVRSASATPAGPRTARPPTKTPTRTSAATASWPSCTTA